MNHLRPCLIPSLVVTLWLASASVNARAASFDCGKGRSSTEQMICHDPALSALDDTLGQLYWKARRRAVNRRAFIVDSDSKWAWREANCRDAACLQTWYATRIEELRRASEGAAEVANTAGVELDTEAAKAPVPIIRDKPARPRSARALSAATTPLECTASNLGIAISEQCATVIKGSNPWHYTAHNGDWFCGIATLPAAAAEVAANAAP
nr:hypothetical protein HUO10_000965 [Paraburkholderia busanensis]